MQPLHVYKQTPSEYILINYAERRPLYYRKVHLTEYEAHNLNQGYALNGMSQRYVKTTSRFLETNNK